MILYIEPTPHARVHRPSRGADARRSPVRAGRKTPKSPKSRAPTRLFDDVRATFDTSIDAAREISPFVLVFHRRTIVAVRSRARERRDASSPSRATWATRAPVGRSIDGPFRGHA